MRGLSRNPRVRWNAPPINLIGQKLWGLPFSYFMLTVHSPIFSVPQIIVTKHRLSPTVTHSGFVW